MKRFFSLAAMLLLFGMAMPPAMAEVMVAKGVEVVDGDTVAIRVNGKRERVRMVDYDAPNIGRFAACPAEAALGAKAKARLKSLVNLKSVTLDFTGDVDPYGRKLAYLKVGKTSVGELLAKRGYAVKYDGRGEHHWPKALCKEAAVEPSPTPANDNGRRALTYLPQNWKPDVYELDSFSYDGVPWRIAGDEPWSFKYDTSYNTFRFEVRKGDRFESSYWSDSVGVERTEMGEKVNHALSGDGKHLRIKYEYMVEPGPQNTAQWLVNGQLFTGGTPPFEIKYMGNDRMALIAKYGTSSNPTERTIWIDSQNIQRGKWYTLEFDVQLDPSGSNGHVIAWRDGVQLVNYKGPIGYSNATESHWEMGAYRKSPSGGETWAVNYKDVDLTWGLGGHSTSPSTGTTTPPPDPDPTPTPDPDPTPTPDPDPTPTPEPGAIYGTDRSDTWNGTSRDEIYYGKGGNDTINGRGGLDVFYGGEGRDVFIFDAPRSSKVAKIEDFTPGVDKIHIQNSVYSGGNVDYGNLPSSKFHIGSRAADRSDRFIYDPNTGALYFDKDGTGSAAQVEVVRLKPGLHLTASDLFIL